MSKELRALFDKLRGLQDRAKNLMTDENAKTADIEAVTADIHAVKVKIDAQKAIDEAFNNDPQPAGGVQIIGNKVAKMDKNSEEFRKLHTKAFLNMIRGKYRKEPMTQEMKDALSSQTGADGGYLLPQDINTQINLLKRQYKSAKICCTTVYPTTMKTGSFVWENLSTLTPLVNMTEGANLDQTSQPKFDQKPYAIQDYGALLPIPNTLLQDEDANLIGYIAQWFAKKAIRTENLDIFNTLKSGKTIKALADWKALKSSFNRDLDPILQLSGHFCMNQDAFDVLDSALDGDGRPVMQPDPQNLTERLFMGHRIDLFSNVELPSAAGLAPIYYGAMEFGCQFVDRGVYEVQTSLDYLFGSNMTAVRVIERYDVIQTDSDAYMAGTLPVPA